MNIQRLASAGMLLALALLLGRTSLADDSRTKALQIANDGIADYNAGRFPEALAKFREAYRTFPAQTLLLNLSHAQLMLGQCDEAFDSMRKYSDAVPGEEANKYGEQVETLCPEVRVTSDPGGASLWLDDKGGRPVGVTPWKGHLPPGNHSVAFKMDGREDGHEQFSVEAGHGLQIGVTLPTKSKAKSKKADDAAPDQLPFALPPVDDAPVAAPAPAQAFVAPTAAQPPPAPPPQPAPAPQSFVAAAAPAAPTLQRPPPPPQDDPDAPHCDSGLNKARQTNCSDGLVCSLTKHCVAARYDESNGIVSDMATGLMWQQNVASESRPWSASDTPGSAQVYCQQLNLGGVTDWRLPSVAELFSLVKAGASPAIDRSAFPRTPAGAFWSSTRYASDPSFAWDVNFDDGGSYYAGVGTGAFVRCVR